MQFIVNDSFDKVRLITCKPSDCPLIEMERHEFFLPSQSLLPVCPTFSQKMFIMTRSTSPLAMHS